MKNISKIISIVFLSFSILLMCYVFYRSQIFHAGILFDFYLKYYVIASLCILFSFISFFIPKKLKINITIFFTSILIGLYLVEGYIIMQYINKDKFVIYKNNTGKDYDQRTIFEIYHDLIKEDPNVAYWHSPTTFLDGNDLNYFLLSGLSNRKTINCNENGYYSIYQSDRYGFNNPDGEWDKDKIEFLLVGDSFTHGACVNEPDTISGNLRKLYENKSGVLNLGQSASGPLIEYATLREYLSIKKVKRVLWMYFEKNDLRDLMGELKSKILVNYLKDKSFTQNLVLRNQEIQKLRLNKLRQKTLKQDRLIPYNDITKFLKLTNVRVITIEIFFSVSPTKEFENILQFSNELIKENNSKLYFVYLPEYYRYSGFINEKNFRNYKKITNIVKNLDIPIIDINKELFRKHDDPLSLFPFRKLGHYNEKGYQLVAETIFRKINELEK